MDASLTSLLDQTEILTRRAANAEICYLSEQLEFAIIAEAKRRLEEEKNMEALAHQIALQQIKQDEILASETIY